MMVKRITKIDFDTNADGVSCYSLDQSLLREYEVKDISFRRDGYSGINKDGKDESHYLIRLVNELNDKDVIFILIPKIKVKEIMFKEEEAETQKEEIKLEKV